MTANSIGDVSGIRPNGSGQTATPHGPGQAKGTWSGRINNIGLHETAYTDVTYPSLFEMMYCLASAMDAVSPAVAEHHKRTAVIARSIGQKAGRKADDLVGLLLGGMVHDCGAFSLKAKLDALKFDLDLENPHHHAQVSYSFLCELENLFPHLSTLNLANTVRYHHVRWENGRGESFEGNPVPLTSHILHLADRVEVSLRRDRSLLDQSQEVYQKIKGYSGHMFVPELVEAFGELAKRESFWLDLDFADDIITGMSEEDQFCSLVCLDLDGQVKLARLFGHLVDFRSPFTARHSSGVSSIAQTLADLFGFSPQDQINMAMAGYLHDIGKLAVPPEILEKPGQLTQNEFNMIKAHPYHTYRLLAPIKTFEKVAVWASEHHETLNGSGYPFRRGDKDLALGSRILAVADIFAALTEDRPYRRGMATGDAIQILRDQTREGKLDPEVVSVVEQNLTLVENYRLEGQSEGYLSYQDFKTR